MMMKPDDARKTFYPAMLLRYMLPYQFIPMHADGYKHVYLPLNRDYKPVGLITKEWVRYEEFEHLFVRFPRNPHSFADIWHDSANLYLYSDNVQSKQTYFERLARLSSRMKLLSSD